MKKFCLEDCPECSECATDCFAYEDEKCKVLRDTVFKHYDCPFYKSKEQYRKEQKKYETY